MTGTDSIGGFPLVPDSLLRLHEAEADGDEARAERIRGVLSNLRTAEDTARMALTKESV